jgi:hypothetical protein
MSDEYNAGRREFFRTIIRGLLLSISVAGVFSLTTRRSETCTGGSICRGCGEFNKCGLPQALSARTALDREKR